MTQPITDRTALEASFADISQQHGLLSFDVGLMRSEDGWQKFTVSMQWPDPSQLHGRGCAQAHEDTIAECVSSAIRQMLAKRGTSAALADEPLPVEA